ncbi:MAG: universal stress protein [Flavobacteriales bacterium]|nr:universal stress protein [Flavobacteriales bacterium]
MNLKSLLVPIDFTAVSKIAMDHAAKLAETIGASVVLLHVVAKAEEVAGAKEKLSKESKNLLNAHPEIKVSIAVRIGNIFEDIAQTAAEESAELIIMGTHGASGWQKLTGSHALKVITSSKVPFIVVQTKGIKPSGYDDIVVPMDLGTHSKQKLETVVDMAKYFNSRVHIFADRVESEAQKVKNNIVFAHKYLSDKGIKHDTKVAEKAGNFDAQVLSYSEEVDADLIVIMNEGGGMFGGKHEQAMITNSLELPVMIVNAKDTSLASGSVFSR